MKPPYARQIHPIPAKAMASLVDSSSVVDCVDRDVVVVSGGVSVPEAFGTSQGLADDDVVSRTKKSSWRLLRISQPRYLHKHHSTHFVIVGKWYDTRKTTSHREARNMGIHLANADHEAMKTMNTLPRAPPSKQHAGTWATAIQNAARERNS